MGAVRTTVWAENFGLALEASNSNYFLTERKPVRDAGTKPWGAVRWGGVNFGHLDHGGGGKPWGRWAGVGWGGVVEASTTSSQKASQGEWGSEDAGE